MTSTLKALLYVRKGWGTNLLKFHSPAKSVKFLEVEYSRACQKIPSKLKNKLFYFGLSTSKKEAHTL